MRTFKEWEEEKEKLPKDGGMGQKCKRKSGTFKEVGNERGALPFQYEKTKNRRILLRMSVFYSVSIF